MKFCKNLQRVVDISDPEWAPYWTNYKMLKVGSWSRPFRFASPNEYRRRLKGGRISMNQRVLRVLDFFFFC
jgi:hypothetical protein